MHARILTTISILLIFLVSCAKDTVDTHNNEVDNNEKQFQLPQEYEKGWVRVKFTELNDDLNTAQTRSGIVETGISELDDVARLLGATKTERVFADGGKYKERRRKYGLHLWYDFYVGGEQPLTRAMSKFAELPFVDIVEAIPVVRLTENDMNMYRAFSYTVGGGYGETLEEEKTNDPMLARQWHYFNDGTQHTRAVPGADVNLFAAWDITTGHPDVVVAVMDGGVAYNHPDLAQNMWINTDEIAGNGVDDDNNGYVDDIYGYRWARSGDGPGSGEILPMDHGSHCAGTIAAVNNNGMGLSGVAGGNGSPNTGVRIMSCQTFYPDPDTPSDPYGNSKSSSRSPDGYAYAADNGAVIVNCSFSHSGTSLSASNKAGIDYFVDNAGNYPGSPMRGGLVVAAAGNDGREFDDDGGNYTKYPASYERVISVAYLTSDYKKSSSSNYGAWVNISAPGGATSPSYAANSEGGVFSTIPVESSNYQVQQGYAYKSGTSMAAPHVAGVAALVLSAAVENGITDMTVEKLTDILYRSARDVTSYDPEYAGKLGVGLIDARKAIDLVLSTASPKPNAPTDISATETSVDSYELKWKTPADGYGYPVVKQVVYWSTEPLEGIDFTAKPDGVEYYELASRKAIGEECSYVMDNMAAGTYYVAVVGEDRQWVSSDAVFTSFTIESLAPNKPLDLTAEALEKYPGTVSLKWKVPTLIFGKAIRSFEVYWQTFPFDASTNLESAAGKAVLGNNIPSGKIFTHEIGSLSGSTTYYFAVRSVDINNEVSPIATANATTGATVVGGDVEFKISDGPVKEKLSISYEQGAENVSAKIKIMNAIGAQVFSSDRTIQRNVPYELNVSKLGAGAYTLVISSEGKEHKKAFAKY